MMGAAHKAPRIDIAGIRREQIVEAAVGIIAEQGLQHLSLSEIENRVGMSRGQLTYYFKTKEAILLAVFDRLVAMMHQRQGQEQAAAGETACWEPRSWVEVVQWVLGKILEQPPAHPEFGALQHTFLSQIGHREDFRLRLAALYGEWRGHMAEILRGQYAPGAGGNKFPARSLASLIQALFHGIAMQVAADPNAIDREEIVELCLDMVGTYLEKVGRTQPGLRAGKIPKPVRTKKKVKTAARVTAARVSKNGVNHA
jgi:AcrR family transcriptional regulator